MKVLVTGGAGFIGRWVVKKLLEKKHDVWVLDDLSNGSRKNISEFDSSKNFHGLTVADVSDEKTLGSLFQENLFDVCIHAAAQINVQESIDFPQKSFDSNILGTFVLLNAAKKHGTKIVAIGTCMVYDLALASNAIDEKHQVKPLSPYAASKIAAESLVESFGHSYGLKTVILRPFNTYGPFQKSNMEGGVISIFLKNKIENKPLKIFGDGKQTRDFLYVEDCADFIVKASFSKNAVGQTINAGSGSDISIKALAGLIENDKKKVQHIAHHHPQAEIKKLQCNCSKAKKILGWAPKVSLKKGIERTKKWLAKEGG